MLCNQKGKVGVVRLFFISFIAVSVYCDDTVGIFIYHNTVRIHTESTHIVLEFFCTVYDLALVKLICQVCEDHCRKLYTDTNIHTV